MPFFMFFTTAVAEDVHLFPLRREHYYRHTHILYFISPVLFDNYDTEKVSAASIPKTTKQMDGEEFLTINPETFSDTKCWQYKDLQKLCAKLELGGKGSRLDLENRLCNWHRTRNDCDEADFSDETNSHFPMNVPGNNFSLMHINVKVAKKQTKKRRSSIHRLDEQYGVIIDAQLLRPICRDNVTPGKSILKKIRSGSPKRLFALDDERECENQSPSKHPATKLSKLQFSPFNGVKIISHRHELCISPFDICD
jgi:hypothetical protein